MDKPVKALLDEYEKALFESEVKGNGYSVNGYLRQIVQYVNEYGADVVRDKLKELKNGPK